MAARLAEEWPFALRGALEVVAGSWLVVVLPTVVAYAVASTRDAAAALSVGSAMRAGTWLWALALGGRFPVPGEPGWTLSLPLLGVTVLTALMCRSAVRRARLTTPAALLVLVPAVMVGAWIALAATGADTAPARWAVVGLGGLAAVLGGADLQHRGHGSSRLTGWWRRRPEWVASGLRLAGDVVAVLAVLSALAVVVALGVAARGVGVLHDALTGGGVVATLGVVALEVGWVPTVVVWALAWLAGPGFAVGTGTVYSPAEVRTGPAPALPLLAALPSEALGVGGGWGVVAPLLVTLVAVGVAVARRRRLRELLLGRAAGAAVLAALVVCTTTLLACLLASGSVGPGTMSVAGPFTWPVVGMVALEVGGGLVVTVVALHPVTHRTVRRLAQALTARLRGGLAALTPLTPPSSQSSPSARAALTALRPRRRSRGEAMSPSSTSSSASTDDAATAVSTDAPDAPDAPDATSGTGGTGGTGGTEYPGGSAPVRLVVLVSGTGSNLAALLEACQDPCYGAQVVGVVADKECTGLEHARAAGVGEVVVSPRDYADRTAWDQALTEEVARMEPELIVCAGFMRILGQPFLERFEGSIINTHPSLLPSFPGAHAVCDALAAGATLTGATLFWVDAGVDTGAHIAQVEVPVEPGDTEETLTARVKAAETPQLIEQVGILARGWRTRS